VKAKISIATSIAASAALTFMAVTPANAEEATPMSATTSSYAPDCLAQVEAHPEAGLSTTDCLVTNTVQVDDSFVPTATDISTSALSAEDKAEILSRKARGAITAKHWSQFTTGAAYTRTHNGTFYYDGSRVWVATTTSGYTGSHQCFTNYSVGFNLTGTACNESGSTSARNLYSAWDVNPNGTPIVYNVSMTATVKANGTISGYGATVG
jgi:hypothetical protein